MKNRKLKSFAAFVLTLVMIFSCVVSVNAQDEQAEKAITSYEASRLKKSIANITIQMAKTYYYGVLDEDLLYRALCATIDNGSFDLDVAVASMVKLLDDGYSEYYTPERFQSFYTNISGEFYGIGVTITLSGDHVVVASVFPDSPAEKAGIMPYDTIVSIDGTDIKGLSVSDVANLIKREKGAKVTVGVVRKGENMYIDCFCDEVNQNPISYEIMENGKIGYIYLSTFSLNMDEFLEPVLKEFKEKGITNIILDIRNNGGGELNAAIDLAKHFVPEGIIAKLKYKDSENNSDLTVENGMTKSPYNMVLLVNENSASASELFAGAVKDRKAGTIIGTNTYGKGSMQTVYRLSSGSGIKYTIAEFYSPNDNRIHTIGIEPDYVVENTTHAMTENDLEDLQFRPNGEIEGKTVLAVEQRLSVLGYFDENPNEVFDDATKEAVKQFQMVRNLEITGELDVYTLVALNDIIYEYTYVSDDQLEAAKNYLLTGNIEGN